MSHTLVLTNARLVLDDTVMTGTLTVSDGRILAISDRPVSHPDAIDCGGDDLLPGLVELHTDNLEKHLMPRNGVFWPILPAVATHDAQCVAGGITTVFDALSVGDLEGESVRIDTLHTAFAAICDAMERRLLRADHLFHLRCELAWPELVPTLAQLVDHPAVRLVSVMDHTPGQRQYRDLDQYRKYYAKKHVAWNDDTFLEAVKERKRQQARYAHANKQAVLAIARERRLVLASHDDTDTAHIREAVGDGVSLSEFPTTLEAARAAREAGLATIMGAPNVVRGGSHSGNVAAVELARAGLLDILSSDYVPVSLLDGAYRLVREADWSLPRAIATVTSAPARAAGLADRGRLAPGLRADLVRARHAGDFVHIRTVWKDGERVF
ncbi:alpha-D-ribose 1-methylphosphonate 5-triphosphate diphosphatase [Paludibacterium paludis]|uniref:Phosphonate metabolism protein PhnM n=1 Tax=Paludibacterium paludis TaxID=1225769 RepID=A0A918NXL1_9NEIS|nr:alpha-D-ribose 1-methylphosphonate 5-triphosphate diphosphatase [Paludibacterium paludis]GGY04038.1 phosphonate metabolism protein PhnM [Paludibacterium paludis]